MLKVSVAAPSGAVKPMMAPDDKTCIQDDNSFFADSGEFGTKQHRRKESRLPIGLENITVGLMG